MLVENEFKLTNAVNTDHCLDSEVLIGDLVELVTSVSGSFGSDHRVVAIVDSAVMSGWGQKIRSGLTENWQFLTVSGGEQSKNLDNLERLAVNLLDLGFTRTDWLVCIGGGVLGDLVGMLASLYMRGVKLIQVPTTLVAQGDASIGGKTAVNLPRAKNVLGTFYPARYVLIDPTFLQSLPEREYLAGLAEVLKHGLLAKGDFLEWFEGNIDAIRKREVLCLKEIVRFSSRTKLGFVADDLEDRIGKRALLNFGHTVGHAMEVITDYRRFLHGEAVACGMLVALKFGIKQNFTDEQLYDRVEGLFSRLGLPTRVPNDLLEQQSGNDFQGNADRTQTSVERAEDIWVRALLSDKKRDAALLKYVLVGKPGEACVIDVSPENLARFVLAFG